MTKTQMSHPVAVVSEILHRATWMPARITLLLFSLANPLVAQAPTWAEEFNGTGPANPAIWSYEQGYQRNNEEQYYTSNNGWQEGGMFIIEARKEQTVEGSGANQTTYEYTSSSIRSVGNYSWMYGRAQIRAKIPALSGMWPAIWTVGDVGEWPYNGECDIMEYYQSKILANCAVGNGDRWGSKWDGSNRTMTSLLAVDPDWKNQFHIWTMQWDQDNVRLYCDNILLNTIPQTWLVNTGGQGGSPSEPFKQPHNLWLNLAMGGAGGDPSGTMNSGPKRYLIDYWRIWEGATDNVAPTDIALSANSVNEALPAGTMIGNLTATDADPAEVFRYSLVSGVGDDHNAQFEIPEFVSDSTTLGQLKTAAVLNYDDGATRSIRVRVTDIEGATYEKVLTITVVPDANILVSAPSVQVAEGATQTFDVKLRYLPASNVTVNVTRSSGDADLAVQTGATLTFSPTNATTWQQVTLAAAQDADVTNGVATFLCNDPSATFADATVTATEVENDNDSPVVDAGAPQTVYLSGPGGGGTVTAGADVFLDAGLDDGANTTWEDSLSLWDLTIDSGVTWVADAGSALDGISSAYDFPGGGTTTNGGCDGASLQNLGTALDKQPITLEIWFKPDASASYLANGQILWETGGDTGFGIFYNDGFVETAHDANEQEINADVSALTGEFIQAVVTYDPTTSTDNFKLYINGVLKATVSRADTDMCGGDGAALGNRFGTKIGGRGADNGTCESFDGKIAIFRSYHNQILTAAEVQANFSAVFGEQVEATLNATVTEPNGEDTVTAWTLVSGPGAVQFGDASSVDTTVSFGFTGTYVLRLTADDGTSVPGDDEVTITVALPGSNNIPAFTSDPFSKADANQGVGYSSTIAGSATDADVDDTLSFAKVSGPAWLSVASNGALSGTPSSSDIGPNTFVVSVTDGEVASPVEATLNIRVASESFSDWAAGPFPSGLSLTDSSMTLDFDGGGLETGLEWVFGGDPTDSADDASLSPQITSNDGEFLVIRYRRADAAMYAPNTTVALEYGGNLSSWTTATHNGTTVIITETDDGADTGIDLVEVKISVSLATGGKVFTRVRASTNP